MFRTAPTIAALLVILAFGALHGTLSGRWKTQADFPGLAAQLDDVPLVIGDWQGNAIAANKVAIRAADCDGLLLRVYRNTRDGREVSVLILLGRPGPLSVHVPEVCYRGQGYRQKGSIVERDLDVSSRSAQFRVIEMENGSGPVPRYLRIYHSWNDGSGWSVPAMPRVAFAGSPFLYKLYITT